MTLVRLAIVAALLSVATTASAQTRNYQPVRVDLTVYGGYASAAATSFGFGAALEPKYNVNDHLAVGFRLEGAGFISQSVDVGDAGTSVKQDARAASTYLLKGDWYFTTTPARPFVGLGLGLYRIGAGSQSATSGGNVIQTAAAFKGFGFCPQVGVNFGGFRLAATYHVVTGGDMVVVTQAVGGGPTYETKLAKNWFAFEIGGTIGGNRLGVP